MASSSASSQRPTGWRIKLTLVGPARWAVSASRGTTGVARHEIPEPMTFGRALVKALEWARSAGDDATIFVETFGCDPMEGEP